MFLHNSAQIRAPDAVLAGKNCTETRKNSKTNKDARKRLHLAQTRAIPPLFLLTPVSEGRGCLEEGCLGLPGVFPDISRTAIFPRK